MFDNFGEKIYNALIKGDRWLRFFEGFGKTLTISLGAILLGSIIGVIVALIKYNNKKFGKFNILNKICDVYLAVFRGTPVYVQLLIMYFIVFTNTEVMWTAIITFGINSGAYVAEIVRAGLESVDDGQIEAGCSLGLSKMQVMTHIVLPQAVRRALPPLCNEFIALIKETAIVGTIGVVDMTKVAAQIVARTYEPFVPYLFTAIMYLAIVLALTYLLKLLERRLAKSDRQ
ncbi:MAG: amino acid ABC transporter permease [Clostridia bacterium]|nr:amino acid ABC transporter permease [Clostridia bacterium]